MQWDIFMQSEVFQVLTFMKFILESDIIFVFGHTYSNFPSLKMYA